ncbi:MAG: ferredoxin reductase [Thermomicrobiales bacterium]
MAAPIPRSLPWSGARVVAAIPETPRARTLVLEVAAWPGHRPGQHLDIRLTAEDGYRAERSYSIASAPQPEPDIGRIEIMVERLDDGEVSPYLVDEVRAGDQMEVRGPIGGYFTWDIPDGGPLLLVGGGSGIAPLMAMLRHRVAAGSGIPVRLLYSVRTPADVVYRRELLALAADDPTVEVIFAYTRGQPPGWTGFARRLDDAMMREVAWPPEDAPLAFVCGPNGFVEAASRALVAQGHAPARIRTERFGPTG